MALSMKKLCSRKEKRRPWVGRKDSIEDGPPWIDLISKDTKLILLGANPGSIDASPSPQTIAVDRLERKSRDDALAEKINRHFRNSSLSSRSADDNALRWVPFLSKWYGNTSLWEDLTTRKPQIYQDMISRRIQSLSHRAPDLAHILKMASPARNSEDDWTFATAKKTFYIAGEFDVKYSAVGKQLVHALPGIRYVEIPHAG